MKKCARCREVKPLSEFNAKGIWYQPYCKPCHSDYRREHYQRNKDKYIEKASGWTRQCRERNVVLLLEYFVDHPCVDCGETDPVVLQFDHVRGTKSFGIGKKLTARRWESLLEEIKKCDVRCANCHVRKTAHEQGWFKLLAGEV